MSEEIEALEKRLEKLQPLGQEALTAKILENWRIVKGENASAAPAAVSPLFGVTRSASPRSRCFASLSLCSAATGAIAGAAATFLGMTFFTPPKVEIREVVREVRVQAEPASDVKAQPPETNPAETNLAADRQSSPAKYATEIQSIEQPRAKTKELEDRLVLSDAPFRELDALLAERQALARRMARYGSNDGSVSSGFVPPRISPEEYRELLRELKL
jgi:anti-sigma factor RsiW